MKISKYFQLTSFENASILRKMTILYFLMSIVPVSVLYYLYMMLRQEGEILIEEPQFALVITFVVLGVAVGYFALRGLLMSVIKVSADNTALLKDILGEEKIQHLAQQDRNEVAILAQSFNEVTAHLEENVRNLELAKRTLHSVLTKIGEGITAMDNIDSFLSLIVETVTEALSGKKGMLFLKDEKTGEFVLKFVFGRDIQDQVGLRLREGNTIIQELSAGKTSLIFNRQSAAIKKTLPFLEWPLICAPLILHEDVLGVIAVSGRETEEGFSEDELGLLFNLALQTAVAIENSKLNENVERTYFETISALAMAVEAKDPYSRGHLDRVATLCVQVGKEMGLGKNDIMSLRDAAKLHDIGKIGVTDKLLTKPGPLSADEMALMRRHVEIGASILQPISTLSHLCPIIRHHHEKLDGTGYPDGLKGDAIPLEARILTVTDIYDALTSDRPYRDSFTPARAVSELRTMSAQVDPKVVDALAKVVL